MEPDIFIKIYIKAFYCLDIQYLVQMVRIDADIHAIVRSQALETQLPTRCLGLRARCQASATVSGLPDTRMSMDFLLL